MRFTVEPSGAGGGDLVDLRDGSEGWSEERQPPH
jgi:hypothetical protein